MERKLTLSLMFLALSSGTLFAQEKPKIDWDAAYEQLLESDPGVLKKIESGQATKEDVIRWLKETRGAEIEEDSQSRDLTAFRKKLDELVESGKLSKEDAAKLAATVGLSESAQKKGKKETIDWDAEYEKLLRRPAIRKKIEQGGATKEQVIEFLKKQAAAKVAKGKGRMKNKPGARKGSLNFYAIVIGKLRSKDIELGELEMDVDYVLSDADWAKKDLVGQRVRLVGVAGTFLDNLLRIKRGQTIKVRTGDFNPKKRVLGFGYKFQVLERTAEFNPDEFGVPPQEFRGFQGELVGKVVESLGYEVLLQVQQSKPAEGSQARDAQSVLGKRVRIAGFYNQHADAFAALHEADRIRVSVAHLNSESDSLSVTDTLETLE